MFKNVVGLVQLSTFFISAYEVKNKSTLFEIFSKMSNDGASFFLSRPFFLFQGYMYYVSLEYYGTNCKLEDW